MAYALEQQYDETNTHVGDIDRLDDGTAVTIRAIEPADAFRLRRMFDRLSPESIYHRFFSPIPRPKRAALLQLAGVDHDRHESLVAEIDHEVIGVARFDGKAGSEDAEVAAIVEDDWQGRGVGTLLLHRLAGAAARRGLTAFRATVLGENRAALRFLRRLSPEADVRFEDGEYVAYAPLGSRPGSGVSATR